MYKIALYSTQPIHEAAQCIFTHHFKDFLKSENDIRLNKAIHVVHNMRVVASRLRASLPIFKNSFSSHKLKFLNQTLKKISSVLAEGRNWDIFIAKLLCYQQAISFFSNFVL